MSISFCFRIYLVTIFPVMISVLCGCAGGSSSSATHSALNSSVNTVTSLSSSSAISYPAIKFNYANESPMQVGELRLPVTASPQLFPVVIVVHGGCWVSSLADYHFMDNFSNAITDLGYATWNIEYRAIGTGGEWPVMFQDLNKAVDYVRTLGQAYPLDLNKVIVIGHSAGGHIALWIASRGKLKPESVLYTENPLMIRGAISLAGIANVTATNTACGNEAINIIGANTVARLGETSPLHMLPIGVRTILMSGRSDNIVPSSIGIEYNRKAMELGDDSKHYDLEGMTHFDLIDPARTDWVLYQSAMKALLGE